MGGRRILYYAVGPVHPRNLGLIADSMPEWDFSMIYESEAWWMDSSLLADLPFEKICFVKSQVPDEIIAEEFAAVVFSSVQPRPAPVNLLMWALDHGIPTIAIEESNQLALYDGALNNYLLPVDHLLVASLEEQRGFVAAGVPERRVQVTGWPFYPGHVILEPEQRARAKEAVKLRSGLRVATLTLAGLNDTAGETPSVRRALMRMAVDGLPSGYQLAIKPHPIEEMEVLMPFVEECAPGAVVIDGSVKIGAVLDATDVLLNRGVSQVAIEALTREIPVVVLSAGWVTPFHRLAPEVVAAGADEVAKVIDRLAASTAPMDFYAAYRREHMPYSAEDARARTCERIAAICKTGARDPDPAAQRLDLALYAGWKVGQHAASAWLQSGETGPYAVEAAALARLLCGEAGGDDLARLRRHFDRSYSGQVLRCIWLDQMVEVGERPEKAGLDWMVAFPPPINVNLFAEHCSIWAELLERFGYRDEARAFAGKLQAEWGHIPEFAQVIEEIGLRNKGMRGRGILAIRSLKKKAKALARKALPRY